MLSLLLCIASGAALEARALCVPQQARAETLSPAPASAKNVAWCAWIESPGGELPFVLELDRGIDPVRATIVNGEERILVPRTSIEGDELVLEFPHYDSTIRAKYSEGDTQLAGEWRKRSGPDRWTSMKFAARIAADPHCARSAPAGSIPAARFAGRWAAKFAGDEDLAIGVFGASAGGRLHGTFLTTTGDFRYLDGHAVGQGFYLSCFDGAHAFLFTAQLASDGKLNGEFWSGDRWHDTWTATHDEHAVLPDTFGRSHWNADVGLASLVYPDTESVEHSLAESAFTSKAIVLQILGSWCPNCHDETAWLARVADEYGARGLSVIGLAFEVSGDYTRDLNQVLRMRQRHDAHYPFLLAGSNNKERAGQAFPALDRVFAFPTTIFLHRDGRVRAVHSGFSGPATGAAFTELDREFRALIDELLTEPDADDGSVRKELLADSWRDERDQSTVRIVADARGALSYNTFEALHWDRPTKKEPIAQGAIAIAGTSVRVGTEIFQFDRRAGVLLDARDWGRRLTPAGRSYVPFVDRQGVEPSAVAAGLKSADALLRRETLYYIALALQNEQHEGDFDPLPLLADADHEVRCVAAWACGQGVVAAAGPQLVTTLAHGFAGVRREAARALGKLKFAPAVEPLRALKNDVDPLVREAAAAAIAAIEAR